jgi:hypothetical protein
LLYDILRQCPHLTQQVSTDVPYLTGKVLANRTTLKKRWTVAALLHVFERLSELKPMDINFCIFIDGLDEYYSNHDDLICTISRLTQLNIKLCVSSRPSVVFEEAYGHTAEKLYLQDLNEQDIQLYVSENLRMRPAFQALHAHNAETTQILDEVVERAQGVFLWVYLVVQFSLKDSGIVTNCRSCRNDYGIILVISTILSTYLQDSGLFDRSLLSCNITR